MTLARRKPRGPADPLAEVRAHLAEAEETLRAIRSGEVDAVVHPNPAEYQVYTLDGAGDAYRLLIESMNEGALTLTTDTLILYSNACFAKMVRHPLEHVIGASFREFLAVEDRQPLRALLKRTGTAGTKIRMNLRVADGSWLPALLSVRMLSIKGSSAATVGMVVTDMTEARRTEELLRGFSRRVVQVQEAERERVSLQLHGHITQLLCAILVRAQVLVEKLSQHNRPAREEAKQLQKMVVEAAAAVESISRQLRPSVLDHLGLAAILRSDAAEFAKRTGVPVELNCGQMTTRLPAAAELAFYRILQEALKNVEHHSRARQATVHLTQNGAFVELVVNDDGVGFDPGHPLAEPKAKRGFGLMSMRERAASEGGVLSIESTSGKGTTIHARIPIRQPDRVGRRKKTGVD